MLAQASHSRVQIDTDSPNYRVGRIIFRTPSSQCDYLSGSSRQFAHVMLQVRGFLPFGLWFCHRRSLLDVNDGAVSWLALELHVQVRSQNAQRAHQA